jgi:hypothetical protein
MADEYDFSQGARGQYFQRYSTNNLPCLRGIHFLADAQGRKTAALLDWQEHRLLWQDLVNDIGASPDVSRLMDAKGKIIAICLDFDKHLTLWTAIYDRLIAELESAS